MQHPNTRPAAIKINTIESMGTATGSSGKPGGGGFDERAVKGI